MAMTLETVLSKIDTVPNKENAQLLKEFYQFQKRSETSLCYQRANIKALTAYALHLGPKTRFCKVKKKEQILTFIDTKIKAQDADPDKKWITTWNDYLSRIKFFFRWLYNYKLPLDSGRDELSIEDWETPAFARIKKKRTKRLSPYSENEIWERDELCTIIKYEPHRRNKAVLALFWDLDARPHEVSQLQIKHVRFRERYAEGEIPFNTKTGGGPILLTFSFPYVRDWLNEHPFKDDPEARIICSLRDGGPIEADSLWNIMRELRARIIRLLANASITDPEEKGELEYLLKTKKWNPYCIRHSAITHDSDSLPEFALKKKVRWSMNSKQPSRYIKRRMGDGLKRQLLLRDGIIPEGEEMEQKRPSVQTCSRCGQVESLEVKFCSKCSYPLSPKAFEEVKTDEDKKLEHIQEQFEEKLEAQADRHREEINSILTAIQLNPDLRHVKPEVLATRKIEQREVNLKYD